MPRRLADKNAPPDVRSVWVDDAVTGKGTYLDPIVFPTSGGGSSGNVDGGQSNSIYGGSIAIDGGGP